MGASLASWAPCVSLSPSPRVSCVCVNQSSGTGGSRRPCLAAPRASLNLGPVAARPALAALDRVSVRAARAGPGGELPSCPPPALSPAGLLARLLCLCSGFAEGGGVGCWGGGRGGEAPAFLRSGRNLSQRYWSPEEPSCSPGAPPGLSLPVRACWDGHGLGLELGAEQGPHPWPPPCRGCPGQGGAQRRVGGRA